MIESIHGMFVSICDICGDTLTPESDFYDAVQSKKDEQWKSKKTCGVWQDICCDCQAKGCDK